MIHYNGVRKNASGKKAPRKIATTTAENCLRKVTSPPRKVSPCKIALRKNGPSKNCSTSFSLLLTLSDSCVFLSFL